MHLAYCIFWKKTDDGEWYYVESGKARGFIKAKYGMGRRKSGTLCKA